MTCKYFKEVNDVLGLDGLCWSPNRPTGQKGKPYEIQIITGEFDKLCSQDCQALCSLYPHEETAQQN